MSVGQTKGGEAGALKAGILGVRVVADSVAYQEHKTGQQPACELIVQHAFETFGRIP
ncbi:hypothetical protein [Specibacter sp. NPDC078692]|uniref:hypothetical protein n=1 Tax=Specibacter sp. NPDC078692 TaxID=3155818 RepID=UPI00342295E7